MQIQDQDSQVQILGVSRSDIQEIFERALVDFQNAKTRVIYLDASYLYTFHLDDFEHIRKLNLLIRRDSSLAIEWHRLLERWHQDQTVRDNFGQEIKPIQIERTLDRVVNEGLEYIASTVVGGTVTPFYYRSVGTGVTTEALPSDRILVNEINRINVLQNPDGGSLSRDGSTIYSIGNHNKSIATGNYTECGMHNTNLPSTDKMFEHSIFPSAVPHTQNANSIGSTTVIYMCSS